VRMGLCKERKAGNSITFETIDPRIAMQSPVLDLQARLQELNQLTDDLCKVYEKAERSPDPAEFVEILHGSEANHRNYCNLVRSARKEILGLGRPPYAAGTSKIRDEQDDAYTVFHSREGTSTRYVYELTHPDHDWLIPRVEEGLRAGERCRIAERLPVKMILFDCSQVLIAQDRQSDASSSEFTTTLIRQETVARAFHTLFEFFWSQAIDFEEWKAKHAQLSHDATGS